jgi:hypothetical protein
MSEPGTNADIFFWQATINTWHETGDKSNIIEGLRNQRPIPPFAREFIADLLQKKAKRNPRQKSIAITRRNQFIRAHYKDFLKHFKTLKRQGKLLAGWSAQNAAEWEVADIYGLSVPTVQSITRRKSKKV